MVTLSITAVVVNAKESISQQGDNRHPGSVSLSPDFHMVMNETTNGLRLIKGIIDFAN